MDASNPVLVNERVTVRDLRNDAIEMKKQDYAFLKKMVEEGKRMEAPVMGTKVYPVEDSVVKRLEVSGMVPNCDLKGEWKPPLTVREESMLVSDFHIQGVNMTGAHVRVQRTFVQRKRKREVVKALLARVPNAAEYIEKVTYTGGTPKGFCNRLAKWADRKPKPIGQVYKDHYEKPIDVVRRLMPYDKKVIKDWNRPLSDLIGDVTINKASSAGPPWYRMKLEVLPEVFKALETIIEKVGDGSIEKWLADNREFVVAECKNKMDRYEDPYKKTRPYWNFSSPLSMLLSVPCQGFTEALKTFEESSSSNAYGFSYAHGGGLAMWNWMTSATDRPKFACYGDDTRLVWRDEKGNLYCCDPDFEQMDGSIDQETIDLTVDYIMAAYQEQYGKSDLFQWVAGVWKYLAGKGDFLVDGTTIYTNPTGLRTGVVGTTLFDTVKSVLAYNMFVEKRIDPSDVKSSTSFFLEMGLRVKDGTWDPVLINEVPEEGALAVPTPFLGVKLKWVKGAESLEPLPFVEKEALVTTIGNCRQQLLSASRTVEKRVIFDMARGYQVTAAFMHPEVWDAMCDLINNTDATIICQRVQANKGRGQAPDFPMVTGNKDNMEEFNWVSSDGYPTVEFCKNVFLSGPNKIPGEHWIYCFPELEEGLLKMRKRRTVVPLFKLTEKAKKEEASTSWADQVDSVEEKMDKLLLPAYEGPSEVMNRQATFKIPKNFIKYKLRPAESLITKEKKIMESVEKFEEINHRLLEAFHHYGHGYIAEVMLKNGWVPTAEGNWSLDQSKRTTHITSSWSFEAARVLGGDIEPGSRTTGSSQHEPDIPGIMVVPPTREKIMGLVTGLWKYPKASGNVVSRVSAWLSVNGIIVDPQTQVLCQNPARVKFTAAIRGVEGDLGWAVDKDKTTAKNALYEKLYDLISVDTLGVRRYLSGGGNVFDHSIMEENAFDDDGPNLEVDWWRLQELGQVCEDCELIKEGGLENYAWEIYGTVEFRYPAVIYCGGHTDSSRFAVRRARLVRERGLNFGDRKSVV